MEYVSSLEGIIYIEAFFWKRLSSEEFNRIVETLSAFGIFKQGYDYCFLGWYLDKAALLKMQLRDVFFWGGAF